MTPTPGNQTPVHFWVNRGGGPEGPYEEATIVQMVRTGTLRVGNVCRVGTEQWLPLASHPAFAAAMGGGALGPVPKRTLAKKKKKKSNTPLILGLLGVVGMGGLFVCAGGFFFFREGAAHEPAGPPPEITSSDYSVTGEGDDTRVRLEVRTEAEARVSFGPSVDRHTWPEREWVSADASGLAVYEPSAPPFWHNDEPVMVSFEVAHAGQFRHNSGTIEVARPPYLRCFAARCQCQAGLPCSFAFATEGEIRVEGPAGSTVRIGGETRAMDGTPATFAVAPIVWDAARIQWALNGGPGSAQSYPVSIDMPDGASLSSQIVMTALVLSREIQTLFGPAREGHAVEVPGDGRGNSILVMHERVIRDLVGRPESLADIRYVATITGVERTASCGSYQNRATGEVIRVVRDYLDARIQLFNRRTGRRGPRTTIRAPSVRCPRSTGSQYVGERYTQSDVDAWLERRAR